MSTNVTFIVTAANVSSDSTDSLVPCVSLTFNRSLELNDDGC